MFAASFGVLAVVSAAVWARTPDALKRQRMPVLEAPPADKGERYLSSFRGVSVGHYLHFSGIDSEMIRHLREADVLIIGNSRVQFGFPQSVMKPFFARHGLKYYALGFPYSETITFPWRLLQKYDLHPRWVVVNEDIIFFNQPSDYAAEVMRSHPFNAWQNHFETDATYAAIRALHRVLPHLKVLRANVADPVPFRSREDGTVLFIGTPAKPVLIRNFPQHHHSVYDEEVRTAAAFKAEVERRGGQLVFTYVPKVNPLRPHAVELAARLNVPLVSPVLEGLESFDTSHLTAGSAVRFATAFVQEFEKVLATAGPRPK
ncbi:MAG: hypothetical protein HZA89_00875 [Verrucomicrobia bacterium]|nr:hypothetical protein [Verrucomicrobiota bacterium]